MMLQQQPMLNQHPQQMRISPVQQQQQQYQHVVATHSPSMSTTPIVNNGGPVYDLYGMDDFLPTPMETLIGNFDQPVQLSDAARQELMSISNRFVIDPDTELSHDQTAAVIVKCSLRMSKILLIFVFICLFISGAGDIPQVPSLRLVIPRAYPTGTVSVDRAALDLGSYIFLRFTIFYRFTDSFFFDDLQNVIYDRLSRQSGLRTIADYLNTWVCTLILS